MAVLSRFFIDPFRYTIQADDTIFLRLLQDHSVWDSSFEVQKIYNGRWFSHLYTCIVFDILKMNWHIYFLYDLFVFLLLVVSIFCFFNSFMKAGIISGLTLAKKILLSCFSASVFFIFLVDGRYEVFYWISSVSNHLLSIIFFFFLLALFVSKSVLRFPLALLLAFCLGQMNEIYIMNYLLILFFLQLAIPQTRGLFFAISFVLIVSFYFNVTAVGTATRVNRAIPEFSALQASKDIAETFLLPLITYRYLFIKIATAALLVFSIRHYFDLHFSLNGKYFFAFNRLLLAVSLFGICAQCFLLRLVCPYRSMLVYMLTIIYFVFLMASKRMKNPLKLFF
ncbi:MAG: hypothetical protein ACXVNR_04460 [Bacteroidia bacterium]